MTFLLNLKANSKPVRDYYESLQEAGQLSLLHEGNVAPHFANLLRACARQRGWTLAEQYQIPRKGRHALRADGALLDGFQLRHGVWEAKDGDDDLTAEARRKFRDGYPNDNILFQAPGRAILYQNGRLVADEEIGPGRAANLVSILKLFFEYQPPAYEQWETAVEEFKDRVPELARSLLALIEGERQKNRAFRDALASFKELMREAINPNLSDQAVEEMLIQHLLTERIFRRVFDNPDFAQRNIIAREIETVISALTSRHFSRHDFLRGLDRFYGAIETTAATIESFSEKQAFLNTVYEKFFQGFSVKVADTHGIVYTPQPIVEFMVRSVDDILRREFGKEEGLASEGVAILDPFVGTGNFILRVMRQMPKSKLPGKYREELFCNEVMLLPYYIASMNIEHEYYELTGRYEPFEGISLVDTFELAEGRQMPLFAPENTQRVVRQKNTPIFVIIGNPPYNAGQVNENDNNKNRVYRIMDRRVHETYVKDSKASDKTDLSDPYVKAFRWASDRLKDEGVIAYVTNNGFLDGIAFDGVRKHLSQDFEAIYIVDLGGNVRKNPKISGTTHNVFGIQVGVCITFLVRKKNSAPTETKIYYYQTDEFWKKEDKYNYLEEKGDWTNINWSLLEPNQKHTWLTQGMQSEFDLFIPLGTRATKAGEGDSIFRNFGLGVATSRDAWACNFSRKQLEANVSRMINVYNQHVLQWNQMLTKPSVDDFVTYDTTKIAWSASLKEFLERGILMEFDHTHVRYSQYRPFTKCFLYFDKYLNARRYQMPYFFPTEKSEKENLVICVPARGGRSNAWCLCADIIPNLSLTSIDGAQCFPFYTYDEDGRNRRENITDWALGAFRARYEGAGEQRSGGAGEQSPISNLQSPITKWDIFYYVYGLLHHPDYRETYAANLRRELPRIPFVEDFWGFARAGRRLAALHVGYEGQPEYPLTHIENPDAPLDYRVEKMRLSKDKRSLIYNDFLTLEGIPAAVYEYKLGNRSALEWVIDQYRVKVDGRSGIVNDPNNLDDETYILRLVKQVITVSLETVQIVEQLPGLEIMRDEG